VRVRLDDDTAAARLTELPGWERTGDEIVRTFECPDFPSAIAFVVRIGFLAEAKDHHPDLDVRWRRVKVALTTHDAGGLTDWDFELAAQIDGVAPAGSPR
jgi:4a-hydroxytetrahydrobiopterin dehydratase